MDATLDCLSGWMTTVDADPDLQVTRFCYLKTWHDQAATTALHNFDKRPWTNL
jgi:hypothetical protein